MNAPATVICPACSATFVAAAVHSDPTVLCASCGHTFDPSGDSPVARRSRTAIASFALGLSSLFFAFLTGIPAILVGLIAIRDIRGQPTKLTGTALAYAGITLGSLMTVAALAGVSLLIYLGITRGFNGTTVVPSVVAGRAAVLVAPNAAWRWLHPVDGFDPAEIEPDFHVSFHQMDYDDSEWTLSESSNGSGFGYGDDVDVSIGTPPAGSRNTAYFRCGFTTAVPYENVQLHLVRDDGVIVYLDGQEVARDNMPEGEEAYTLSALNRVSGNSEAEPIRIDLPTKLAPGEHVLAVSLHNAANDSSDLSIGQIILMGDLVPAYVNNPG